MFLPSPGSSHLCIALEEILWTVDLSSIENFPLEIGIRTKNEIQFISTNRNRLRKDVIRAQSKITEN